MITSTRGTGETNSGANQLSDTQQARLNQAWSDTVDLFTITLTKVDTLLADLAKERSDLVTQSVYHELLATLGEGSILLKKLSDLHAPTTRAEIDALRVALAKYKMLLSNLDKAIKATDAYIIHSEHSNQ
jgi:1,2-phenylacetyl-CoA epoxidase catalytic subunit